MYLEKWDLFLDGENFCKQKTSYDRKCDFVGYNTLYENISLAELNTIVGRGNCNVEHFDFHNT